MAILLDYPYCSLVVLVCTPGLQAPKLDREIMMGEEIWGLIRATGD